MNQDSFLIEIGTEYLPLGNSHILAKLIFNSFKTNLKDMNLSYKDIAWFATSRRIAIKINSLNLSTYKISKETDLLEYLNKNDKCFIENKNNTLEENNNNLYSNLLENKLSKSVLLKLISNSFKIRPISNYKKYKNVEFIESVRTVSVLFGAKLVLVKLFNVWSSRAIYGHIFMSKKKLIINHANQYPELLQDQGKVIADFYVRKEIIKKNAKDIADKVGGTLNLDNNLLEKITSSVEWPLVLFTSFAINFLDMPHEIVRYILKDDLKCFTINDIHNNLLPYFIFVVDTSSNAIQQIIDGTRKSIHYKLSDVQFLFTLDSKKSLKDYQIHLNKILFHEKLGTLQDKTIRLQKLSGWIAKEIGATVDHVVRAASLSKCDLATRIVSEFNNIKGIVGMYYALKDGEIKEVAEALNDQYYPNHRSNVLPRSLVSCALAIADRIDTLMGFFSVGLIPTSSKDPFALRRVATDIIHIIMRKKIHINIKQLIMKAAIMHNNTNDEIINKVIDFIYKRLNNWYQEQGISSDILQALMTKQFINLADLNARIEALMGLNKLNFHRLIILSKRLAGIIDRTKTSTNRRVQPSLFKNDLELSLANELILLNRDIQTLFLKCKYQEVLKKLIIISETVDLLFREVMIEDRDISVKENRLALLSDLYSNLLRFGDFSKLKQHYN